MYEKLNTVNIGGKEFPIKCNISVLAYIQEKYGTISEFERKLIGVKPVLDKNGEVTHKEDGTIVFTQTEPSIALLKDITPKLIREGYIQAEKQEEEYPTDWKEAFDDFDFDYVQLALSINEEFQRCFIRKKKTNTKNQRSQTQRKSISKG